MLASRVIPCLDLDSGRVVKGIRFQSLRDAGDPVANSMRYQAHGADEIVLLDVSATPQGRASNLDVIRAIREEVSIPITFGGGIRSVDDARVLLAAGADRIAVNTAAVARPELIGELSELFGTQCVVVAVDARSSETGWEVLVRSGSSPSGYDAADWCLDAASRGAGEILLTSWDRDGTGDGYDLDLISAVSGIIDAPIIASGGAASVEHMSEALRAGASAVLAASILHDGITTVEEIKRGLSAAGVEVRL